MLTDPDKRIIGIMELPSRGFGAQGNMCFQMDWALADRLMIAPNNRLTGWGEGKIDKTSYHVARLAIADQKERLNEKIRLGL